MQRTVMQRTWLPLLLVGATLAAAPAVAAESAGKPFVVVTFAGYNELKSDITCVGKLADNPNLAIGLEVLLQFAMKNRPLIGLDKDRPWGVLAYLDQEKIAAGAKKPDEMLSGRLYVPVNELKDLLATLEPWVGKPDADSDGVYKLEKPENKHRLGQSGEKPAYVKQVGKWAVLADKPSLLADAPADPMPLFAGLDAKYLLAVRVNFDAIPAEMGKKIMGEMRRKAKDDLKQRPSESDEDFAIRKMFEERIQKEIFGHVEDIEQATVGFALDSKSGRTHVDIGVTARPGTKTAKTIAQRTSSTSQFTGFLLPEAAVTGNWATQWEKSEGAELDAVVEAIRKKATDDIAKQNQPENKAKAARTVINGLLDVVKANLAAGKADGGMAMILEQNAATIVGGGFVADVPKVESTLKNLIAIARDENPGVVDAIVNLEAGEHAQVKFITATIPLGDDVPNREHVVQLVGETLQVVVGLGPKCVYVAAGRSAMDTVKKIIDASAEKASEKVPPLRLSVDAQKLAAFAAAAGKESDRPQAAMAAQLLGKSSGPDHVLLTAEPIERGVQFRLELEPGILEAVGLATKAGQNR